MKYNEDGGFTPETAEEWLELAYDVSVDYDGYKTVEGLKSLIDELINYIQNARKDLYQRNDYSCRSKD